MSDPAPFHPFAPKTATDVAMALEQVRCAVCRYGPATTCDCKYGRAPGNAGGEKSGCPEMRAAARMLVEQAAEIERLQMEIAGYQVDEGYQRGHEHGLLAGIDHSLNALRDLRLRATS